MQTIKLTQKKYGSGSGVGSLPPGPIHLDWHGPGKPPDIVEYEGKWYLLRTTMPTMEYALIAQPIHLNDSNTTRL